MKLLNRLLVWGLVFLPLTSLAQTRDLPASKLGPITSPDITTRILPGKIPRFYNINNTGIPTVDVTGNGVLIQAVDTKGNDVHSFRIDRTANYTGGTFGFINAALVVNSKVMQSANTFEAAALFKQDVYANAGTGLTNTPQNFNFAAHTRRFGTAPIWAGVLETTDMSGLADPIMGQLALEADVAANGTDALKNRIGIGIVIRRPGSASGGHTGDTAVVGHGIILTRDTVDPAPNRFRAGLSFGQAVNPTEFETGIDFTNATFALGGPAIRMAQGQRIAFDKDQGRHLSHSINTLNYNVLNTNVFKISDSGSVGIGPNIDPISIDGYSALTVGNAVNGGVIQLRDSTIDARFQANASTGLIVGTLTNHAVVFKRGNVEVFRLSPNGRIQIPSLPPANSNSPCDIGEKTWDTNYNYQCVNTNTWKRTAHSNDTW